MIHDHGHDRTIRKTAARITNTLLALALCAIVCSSARAQAPPTRTEELLRQWDLNRDGKVDAGEAELARAKMRRSRSEAMKNDDVDPITGRPRTNAAAASGRGAAPAAGNAAGAQPADDGGLILVPGTGDQTPSAGPMPAEPVPAPLPRRERDPLPGTRVPATTTTIPPVSPPNVTPGDTRGRAGGPPTAASGDLRSGDLSSRARILPDGSTAPPPPQAAGRRPTGVGQPPLAPRPGVIAGGTRPTTGPPPNLNAGRLPGGFPQTRGIAPGGNAPYGRGPSGGVATPPYPGQPYANQPYPSQPFNAAAGSRGTLAGGRVPPGGTGSGGAARGTIPPQQPATTPYRSGMRPQVTQPSLPRTQVPAPAVPRPPRVGPDDFFGR